MAAYPKQTTACFPPSPGRRESLLQAGGGERGRKRSDVSLAATSDALNLREIVAHTSYVLVCPGDSEPSCALVHAQRLLKLSTGLKHGSEVERHLGVERVQRERRSTEGTMADWRGGRSQVYKREIRKGEGHGQTKLAEGRGDHT